MALAPSFAFVLGAVGGDHRQVEPDLVGRVAADGDLRQRAVDVGDGLGDALAQVARLVAVAEFDRLVDAGAGARGDRGAAERAVGQDHVDLDGRVASAVEDLAGADGGDRGGVRAHRCVQDVAESRTAHRSGLAPGTASRRGRPGSRSRSVPRVRVRTGQGGSALRCAIAETGSRGRSRQAQGSGPAERANRRRRRSVNGTRRPDAATRSAGARRPAGARRRATTRPRPGQVQREAVPPPVLAEGPGGSLSPSERRRPPRVAASGCQFLWALTPVHGESARAGAPSDRFGAAARTFSAVGGRVRRRPGRR